LEGIIEINIWLEPPLKTNTPLLLLLLLLLRLYDESIGTA
jgi:hypothetical protein